MGLFDTSTEICDCGQLLFDKLLVAVISRCGCCVEPGNTIITVDWIPKQESSCVTNNSNLLWHYVIILHDSFVINYYDNVVKLFSINHYIINETWVLDILG